MKKTQYGNNAKYDNKTELCSYNCKGSSCTCKHLKERTLFDKKQYGETQKNNNIDYGCLMFQSFKNKT